MADLHSPPRRPGRPPRARTTLPRLAVNATLAGIWAAALLALLVFFLNAHLSLTVRSYWPVAVPLILFYAPASGAAWALLAGVVRLFATFRVRTPWVGFRPFWRFLVADLCLLAGLYAYNLNQAREYLPATMNRHLLGGTLVLALGSLALAAETLRRGLARLRLRPLPLLVAALLLSAGLFGIRERYREVRPRRSASEFEAGRPASGLLLVGLDGASGEDILPLAADGRLPHHRALLQAGSSAPLRSLRPPRLPAAWATIFTGDLPAVHGVVDASSHHMPLRGERIHLPPAGAGFYLLHLMGLLPQRRLAAVGTALPTLDRILQRCGYEVRAAGWEGLVRREVQPRTAPPWKAGGGRGLYPEPLRGHLLDLARHLEEARADAAGAPLADLLEAAVGTDLDTTWSVLQAAASPAAGQPALLVRLKGLDAVLRGFLRYHRPDRFGNVSDGEIEHYGAVISDYYRFADAIVGILAAAAGPEARVVVVSPYGVAPVGAGRRMFNALAGVWGPSGTHDGAGPGLLLAAGRGIRREGRLNQARAEDVLPALLYLLDLPVGQDMAGQLPPGLVTDEFAAGHALAAVPSWATVSVVAPEGVW